MYITQAIENHNRASKNMLQVSNKIRNKRCRSSYCKVFLKIAVTKNSVKSLNTACEKVNFW